VYGEPYRGFESHLLRKFFNICLFYAYILKSLYEGRYYYGSTSNIDNRLKQHNYGKVKTTKVENLLIYTILKSFKQKVKQ
jgi:predicted GIY-YIG superfamily endonuclease